ncbi:MAG: phage tail protein [Clostridiales bacterium]|nr:phage tail protein [Clostridiales bacterium]
MYRIYADGNLIYNDSIPDQEATKLIGATLSLKDNSAGAFEATVPIGNVCYDHIACFTTTIDIYRHNQDGTRTWIWSGRILKISKDFYNYKKITCEGVLAFLNDSTVFIGEIESISLPEYVRFLLENYNVQTKFIEPYRSIAPGAISNVSSKGTSIGNHAHEFDGGNVLSYLSKEVEDWGLHVRIRINEDFNPNTYNPLTNLSNCQYILDLLTDTQLMMAHQSINFGQNLMDYTSDTDWSETITAILPYGGEIDTNDESEDKEVPDRYTIENLTPSTSNFRIVGKYLINYPAMLTYGRIEQTVEWNDVDDPGELLRLAEAYLNDYEYSLTTLKVTVFDLHYLLGSGYEAFNFLDQINCYSKPHGLKDTFIVKEMRIPFDNPENTTFSMSKETHGYYGSTKRTSGGSINGGKVKLSSISSHVPSREGVLRIARENAAAMISMATNGFVTLVGTDKGDRTSALTITNQIDEESSTQMWMWNLGGLMFQDRSSISDDWNSPLVAITMDGQIVATRITTGTLAVDDGNGGYLLLADMDSGTMQVAGFDFSSEYFYHEKSSLNDDNVDGIYIGLDGLSIGNSSTGLFKVDLTNQYLILADSKTSIDDDSTDGFYLSHDGIAIGYDGTGLFKVNTVDNTALIAGFNFDNSKLWTFNKTSADSQDEGFYIGTDGLGNSNGTNNICIKNGRIEGSLNGTLAGYFDTNVAPNGTPGLVLGGAGAVLFSTPSLGVMDYTSPGGYSTYHEGRTDTISVLSGNMSSQLTYKYVTYELINSSYTFWAILDYEQDGNRKIPTNVAQVTIKHNYSLRPTEQTGTISLGNMSSESLIFNKGLLVTS